MCSSDLDFMSQRADQVAVDNRCAEFQRACESYQVTIGVEGISQRLRNYLNKNLTTERLYQAVEYFIANRFHEVKLYMMATELETDEDVEEWRQFFIHIQQMKQKYSSNTRFRQSFSPTNVSPFTTLRWEPPRPALSLAKGIKPRSLSKVVELGHEFRIPFRLSLKSRTVVVNQIFAFNDRRFTTPVLRFALKDEIGRASCRERV